MIRCAEAASRGLGVTLFERLLNAHGDSIGVMLEEQYRMHADICSWASGELYGGRRVATHLLTPTSPASAHRPS